MGMATLISLHMSDDHFLRIVREVARDTSKMKLSRHAHARMAERGFSLSQVYACIRRGSIYEPVHQDIQADWKCTLRHIWAGDEIKVAIALKRNDRGDWIAVLTVFQELSMYHYTECGLDNVWLVNGFHVEVIDGEEYVSFEDADELHRVIGRSLVEKPNLTGAEVRFLRKELGMPQRVLAQFLGTSEQTLSLWERGAAVPDGEGRLLKALYLEKLDGNVKIAELLERIIDLDRKEEERLVFQDTECGWKMAA